MYNDEFNNNDMYRFTNREVPRDDYAPAPRQENTYTAPVRKQGFFHRTWVKVTALVLACAVVGGAAGYGGAALAGGSISGGKTTINESDRTATAVQIKKVDGKTKMQPAEVYASTVNSTVSINCSSQSTNIFGQTTQSASSGSGFIISQDGYIVTNYHVISGASSVKVTLYNGDTYDATVIGGDSDYDVAVLKINASGLQPVTLGESADVNVGDTVLAIGNPLGELTFTMTAGYISALDREITPDRTPINMLQTDVAINAGNSGGPLFDMDGNVIGMTTAKVSGTTESGVSIEGLGFAIPINDVMRVVYDLQRYGRVLGRAYLGVTLQDLDSEVAATYNLPAGPQIVTVTEGSCAETAGLQPRDIILQFEDREISSFTDLSAALAKQKAGDTVTLKIYRAGAELEITLTLDERPGESEIDATEQQAQAELEGQTAPDTDIPDFGGFEGYGYDYDMD